MYLTVAVDDVAGRALAFIERELSDAVDHARTESRDDSIENTLIIDLATDRIVSVWHDGHELERETTCPKCRADAELDAGKVWEEQERGAQEMEQRDERRADQHHLYGKVYY